MVHTICPPLCDGVPPAWLAWTQEEWLLHREKWYGQMDSLLNINTYMEQYFQASLHEAEAEHEVDHTREKDLTGSDPQALTRAEEWLQRVRRLKRNTLEELCTDSVLAPGDSQQRWLLYLPKTSSNRDRGWIRPVLSLPQVRVCTQ